jgi:hypothetical protein
MNYKVLWIDDDCNTSYGRDFIGQAEQDNVDITPFESHEEGILFLESNLLNIHAVILDAKVKHKKDDTVTGLEGLRASRDRLIEINRNNYLPYFIFTGQPDYHTNQMFKESYGNYYIKGIDNVRLIAELIEKVENKVEYILQKKYKDVFDVCSDKYIGTSNREKIFRVLNGIKNNHINNPTYFNEIRKIMESVFLSCNDKGLFPNDCTDMNARSTFLGKKEMQTYVPVYIQRNIHSVVQISQEGSHRLSIDKDVTDGKCPYLLKSTVFELLNILLWFKEFSDSYQNGLGINLETLPNIELEQNWIQGELAEINDKGWGKFLSLDGMWSVPPQMIKQYGFQVGDELEITTKTDNNKHIDSIRKI